jgi:hypothetical protein
MFKSIPFPLILFLAAGSAFAQSSSTSFTGHLDGYQVPGGVSTTATADFKIFVRSSTIMGFDLTPHLPAGAVLNQVSLNQCQFYCNSNPFYLLCGYGSGNPRPTCSQTGYVDTNGGELVASDILPYGRSKDTSVILDLMRHNLVYVTMYITLAGDSTQTQIRAQLVPQ